MLTKIWNWFDGNKMMIGNALIAIAAHLPSDTEVYGVSVISVLYWLGGTFTGGGAIHKAKKKFLPSGKSTP